MSGEKVTAAAGGRLVEVNAHEGDLVRKGDVLARFDTERLDNDIAKLSSTVGAARQEVAHLERLAALQADHRAAELAEVAEEERRAAADVRLAELDVARARDEETRLGALVNGGAVPRRDLEQATDRRREAEERLDRAKIGGRRCAVVEKSCALKAEELKIRLAAKRAEVDAAEHALANLQLEKEQAVLRAHEDGVVTVGDSKPGDVVDAGRPVFAIAQQKGFRVDAAVGAADVGLLRVGMKARVKLDAFDYQKYGALEGTVYTVSPDSDQFETADGRKALVYVVRIRLDRTELPVKFGMTGTVEIVTGRERLLSLALRSAKDRIDPR